MRKFPQGRGDESPRSPTGSNQTPRTNLNYAYPIRPGSQQQQQPQAVSNNVSGPPVGRRPAPPIPTNLHPNSINTGRDQRVPPVRPPRPQFVPPLLESTEESDGRRPGIAYRSNQEPSRSPPPYSEEDNGSTSPSRQSQRSIYIGFDPSSDVRASDISSTSSIGVIPSFPSVPPTANHQPRRVGSGGPPSARRGTSSYYSQQTMLVSPIPEESLSSRHASYASSAVIPSGLEGENPQPGNQEPQGETEQGEHVVEGEAALVRQASLGRKSRPTITQIKSSEKPSKSRSRSNGSSAESLKGATAGLGTDSASASPLQLSPAQKSSPILQLPAATRSTSSLPGLAVTQGQSPVSSLSKSTPSPLTQPPMAAVGGDYFTSPFEKEIGSGSGLNSPVEDTPSRPGIGKRRILPRLNMDAVRDAEARGSLTSLPDLIRRATKLAAVLENGRPNSQWGGRGSFFGAGSYSGRNNSRSTDSISDILASFPPPVFAQPSRNGTRDSRTLSQWPLPEEGGDNDNDNSGSLRTVKENRRICGLPVWAFVLLVLLALVVITAAVIVPLQLVNLSKNKPSSTTNPATQCASTNPCQNGGQTVMTGTSCGCICTNGFMGANCTEKEDTSCTTFDVGGDTSVKNATIGSALPRLFQKDTQYSLVLQPSRLLTAFSSENLSCTSQNALVTFIGRTSPENSVDGSATRRSIGHALELKRRGSILTDTATYTTPTLTATATSGSSPSASSTREPALDQDAVDFARVAVLFLAQTDNVGLAVAEEAQTTLENAFSKGTDFGDFTAGNVTIELTSRSIKLPDGSVVGGPNTTATTSSSAISSSTPSSTSKARL